MDSRADGGGALLPQLVHFSNGREGQAVLRHGFGADQFFVRNKPRMVLREVPSLRNHSFRAGNKCRGEEASANNNARIHDFLLESIPEERTARKGLAALLTKKSACLQFFRPHEDKPRDELSFSCRQKLAKSADCR